MGATAALVVLALASWMLHRGLLKGYSSYTATVTSADGIRVGTRIEMAGLRVGYVESLGLQPDNRILLGIAIEDAFANRVRRDSRLEVIRPFVIGEKSLILSGGGDAPLLAEGSEIATTEVAGLTDLFNGRRLSPYLGTLERVAEEMNRLAEALLAQNGSESLLRSISSLPQLISELTVMSKEMSGVGRQLGAAKHLEKLIASASTISVQLAAVSDKTPELAASVTTVMRNLALASEEFQKVLPQLAAAAPEIPKSTRRMVEAIDEAVVVLKAMQKSFLLRSAAREVREEESVKRAPASIPEPAKSAGEGK